MPKKTSSRLEYGRLYYYHVRFMSEGGIESYAEMEGMPAESTIPSIEAQGGATFAWRLMKKHKTHGSKIHVLYGMAKCCDTDSFCKKIGRTIAASRLAQEGDSRITFNYAPKVGDVIRELQGIYLADREPFLGDVKDVVNF